MRTIIAGCRDAPYFKALDLVKEAIDASGWRDQISLVIHGGAKGIDEAAGVVSFPLWPVKVIRAQWELYGKSAGPRRNALMASQASALIAVWDGRSKGTGNMIKQANAKGLKVYVHLFSREHMTE